MEIKDVFSANPKSVWEYLSENGQGLYIAAYQRKYKFVFGFLLNKINTDPVYFTNRINFKLTHQGNVGAQSGLFVDGDNFWL